MRLLFWIIAPFIMIFIRFKHLDWKGKSLGIVYSFLFLLIVLISVTPDPNQTTIQNTSEQKQETKTTSPVLYSKTVLDAIEKAKNSKENKINRYSSYELSTMLGLKPTEEEMNMHKKVLLTAYQNKEHLNIKSLTDDTLLKLAFSARMVDKYHVIIKNENDPLASFAFDFFQITKDAYRNILEDTFYQANLRQLDKKFVLIE
jgi:hypothetical protein